MHPLKKQEFYPVNRTFLKEGMVTTTSITISIKQNIILDATWAFRMNINEHSTKHHKNIRLFFYEIFHNQGKLTVNKQLKLLLQFKNFTTVVQLHFSLMLKSACSLLSFAVVWILTYINWTWFWQSHIIRTLFTLISEGIILTFYLFIIS